MKKHVRNALQLLHLVATYHIQQQTALWFHDLSPKWRHRLINYMEWRSVIKEHTSVWIHRWGPWSHLLALRSKFFTCSRVTVLLVIPTRNKLLFLVPMLLSLDLRNIIIIFRRSPVQFRPCQVMKCFWKSAIFLEFKSVLMLSFLQNSMDLK